MTSKSPLTHLDHISLLYHPACLSGVLQLQMWPLTHFLNVVLLLSGMPRPTRMVNSYSSLKSLVTHYFVWEDLQKVLCTKYKALLHCSFSGWQTLASSQSSPWMSTSCSSQCLWHQAAAQDLLEWMPCPPIQLLNQDLWPFHLLSISSQQWVSQVLSCLIILHSLCERNRFASRDQCCPPARHPRCCHGHAVDPQRWTVALEDMW